MTKFTLHFVLFLAMLPTTSTLADESVEALNPWKTLMKVRTRLSEGAQQAIFQHEFKAPGWDVVDSETGRVQIELPFCLHLGYDDPDPKNFLLCGHDLYSWHQGEKKGQIFDVKAESSNGLDLLMLSLDQLQDHYGASLDEGEADLSLVLSPLVSGPGIQKGQLTIDRETMKLLSLNYVTEDGGSTTYRFSHWEPAPEATFEPPSQITWEQQ